MPLVSGTMTYTSAYTLGPGNTPASVRWLILATCCISIVCALLNPLFTQFFQIQGPNTFFSLSWYGLKNGYLWQPLTYLFVENGVLGLSFELLITLFFQMYILWMMGSSLAEKVGGYRFIVFYFAVGALTGLATILSAPAFSQYPFLMGPTASILALWVIWTMMHPGSELLFFFLIPIKAKWLLALVFSGLLLVSLSQGSFSGLVLYLTSGMTGYLYGVLVWGMEGPFEWTQKVDDGLLLLKAKILKGSRAISRKDNRPKIIDIHTGTPYLDDEAFVDAMLAKISEKGERSLSWSERRRLRKISEKKNI